MLKVPLSTHHEKKLERISWRTLDEGVKKNREDSQTDPTFHPPENKVKSSHQS